VEAGLGSHRITPPERFEWLLEAWGDWEGGPLELTSMRLIVKARKY
jgi:hypothetical protein